jgi:hypothetical protein
MDSNTFSGFNLMLYAECNYFVMSKAAHILSTGNEVKGVSLPIYLNFRH